jgi:hypothetical protein
VESGSFRGPVVRNPFRIGFGGNANVIRVTGGNVRPFERLLIQIQPVIETNKMGLVSEPMEAARENLIVGRTQ